MRATTRLSRPPAFRCRTRCAMGSSRSGSRHTAATSGLPMAACRGTCVPCPTRWAGGWRNTQGLGRGRAHNCRMDDIVKQAMAKWPNVPDCYGWLGLDARGDWYMRDDRVQVLGAFTSGVAGAKGSRLLHDKLIAFIQRNYQADEQGRWFFQNGPQRVYVELE